MAGWDSQRVKAQLRQTAQRLGQLQSKQDSAGQVTRGDIATLLGQRNVPLARAKAQKLLRDEAMADVLEVLEMHVGTLLERFAELETSGQPSPPLVEAASSVIFAAPQTESKDLQMSSEIIAQRLGPDFTKSAIGNRDGYVSPRIIRGLSAPPPSASHLDEFMYSIAKSAKVDWKPELRPHEKLHILSEILDPASTTPIIDMPRLRKICLHGLPQHPPWLRPRIWRLLLGTLPVLRSEWVPEAKKQRDSYYDLVCRLLEPFASLPDPTSPLSPQDQALMEAYNQLSRVPANLFSDLEEEPEAGVPSPLDDAAPADVKIACAGALDHRLRSIRDAKGSSSGGVPEIHLERTPEIRLQTEVEDVPEISLSSHDDDGDGGDASGAPHPPPTILHSKILSATGAHPKHATALLRLLYVHDSLNPASRSPHVASLLVPLYAVLQQEIEPAELAHAEADTFWAFEAMVGEFRELEDEQESTAWTLKLSQRVAWADDELFANLHAKGLDPALPHYSYRWLAPLLTHTLPLASVYPVWDALFSRTGLTRNANPKIEHLLNICTSMLLRARAPLFALGKAGRRSPSLWSEESSSIPPPSPLKPWEAGDAFLEGMSLLQLYPIEAAGGLDGILQTASDLLERLEAQAAVASPQNAGLGARIRDTMWRGFTNRATSPLPEDEEEQEEAEEKSRSFEEEPKADEQPAASAGGGWGSFLTEKVIKGITNQSAMEAPPSPVTPSTPVSPMSSRPGSPSGLSSPTTPPRLSTGDALHPSSASRVGSLWNYASKLKDSDTAASLAKASSNWTAAAMNAWGSRGAPTATQPEPAPPSTTGMIGSPARGIASLWTGSTASSKGSAPASPAIHSRTDSVASGGSGGGSDTYAAPPKPAFFRPPRDSWMPPARTAESAPSAGTSSPPEPSPQSESFLDKAKHLQESLSTLTGIQVVAPKPTTPKAGPRPLLLGKGANSVANRRSITPTPQHQRQWSEVSLGSQHGATHRDSISSLGSLAPSDIPAASKRSSGHLDWDSDSGRRGGENTKVVPLRRSVSPMAPNFRLPRPTSTSSIASSNPRESLHSAADDLAKGWGQRDSMASATASSLMPETPSTGVVFPGEPEVEVASPVSISVSTTSNRRGAEIYAPLPKTKTPPPPALAYDDTSEDSAAPPTAGITLSRSPRAKGKRSTRPENLELAGRSAIEAANNSLKPDFPGDEVDVATTPRASRFEDETPSSASPPSDHDVQATAPSTTIKRTRKVSARSASGEAKAAGAANGRTRKVSATRRPRDSEAEHGDDEGYDEFLSAYESEDV